MPKRRAAGSRASEAAKGRIRRITHIEIGDDICNVHRRLRHPSGFPGSRDGKSPAQPSKLNDVQRQAIARMIESGPIPAVHGVVRWRLIDLAQWIFEEFRITIAKQTSSRELRAMSYRKLSGRPRHHAQAEGVIEDFKKARDRYVRLRGSSR